MERGAPNDVELALRARQGDREAFQHLVERHQETAYRVAYLVTGSAQEAEDAAQDAFVKAYLALDRFRAGEPFRPWLLRIVGNEARNRRRAWGRRVHYERRVAQHTIEERSLSPEAAAEAAETRLALLDAVNGLPKRERIIIGLRFFLELSEEETAAAVGIPRGTVKSRTSRALERLREELVEAKHE